MGPKILAPGIVQFDFSEKVYTELIEKIKDYDSSLWEKSGFYMEAEPTDSKPRRKSQSVSLAKIDSELNDKIVKSVKFNSNIYKSMYGISFDNCEGLDVLKYTSGDYFLPHYDGSASKYRTVSFLIYLNVKEYIGGETIFHNFNLKVSPENPCMLFFPSNYPYSHSSSVIQSGTKYIIVSWCNDLPHGKNQNLLD